MTLPHTGCLNCNSGPDRLLCSSRGGESWSFGRGFYHVLSLQIINREQMKGSNLPHVHILLVYGFVCPFWRSFNNN